MHFMISLRKILKAKKKVPNSFYGASITLITKLDKDIRKENSRTIISPMTEMFCILTMSISISWMGYYTTVLQDITTSKNQVIGTLNLYIISSKNACESIIISK